MIELRAIAARLQVLQRRQHRLIWGRAAALASAGVLGAWLLLVLGVFSGAPKAIVLGVAALAVLASLSAALAWAAEASGEADLQHQARTVEALRPSLEGRLLVAAERSEGPLGEESPGLLALAARRAVGVLDGVAADEVHPRRPFERTLLAVTVVALALALSNVLPLGPMQALRFAFTPGASVASDILPPAPDEKALVGDIVLRYVYPDYTRLDPVEVPNSDGTAHGPPGTRVEVSVRTGRVWQAAELQVDDRPPTEASVVGGRDVAGSFLIEAPGAWRLLFQAGGGSASSPDHPIEIDEDLAPTVELTAATDRLEVPWNQRIPARWSARDDYGVVRIVARVETDGDGVVLREDVEGPRRLEGEIGRSPFDLGLSPGDTATLTVEAWDNDTVSGSKAGRSRTLKIVVLGPKGQARRYERIWRELRDALVGALAPFVTEPELPTSQAALASWGADTATRFEPVDALQVEHWDVLAETTLEGLVVHEVRRQVAGLLRFVQQVADPRSDDALDNRDRITVIDQRAQLVTRLESAVLMLDGMLRYRALKQIYALAADGARASEGLARRSEGGALPGEVLSRLDRVDRASRSLNQAAATYESGSSELVLRAVVELDTMSTRLRESFELTDEARARALARRLAEGWQMLEANLEYRVRQQDEQAGEQRDMLKELLRELERLEIEERELLQHTRGAREADGGGEDILAARWERLEGKAAKAAEVAAALETPEVDDRTAWWLESQVERLEDQTARLLRAVEARDLAHVEEEAMRAWSIAEEAARRLGSAGEGSQARDSEAVTRALRRVVGDVTALDASANMAGPTLRGAVDELAVRQAGARRDTVEAEGVARRVAGFLPLNAPGLVENIEGAVREMVRAEAALDAVRGVEAEGAEQAAAERLRVAREALASSSAAWEQQQQRMSDGADEARPDDPSAPTPQPEKLQPLDPEDDQAYRDALLEGMQGEVPPEFEVLKRRYYEELVR